MKCYYKVSDDWLQGEIASTRGDAEVNFCSRAKNGRVVHEITLLTPEFIFAGGRLTATGYVPNGVNTYKLTSVEVVFDKRGTK